MKKTYISPICEYYKFQMTKSLMIPESLPTENDDDSWIEDQFGRRYEEDGDDLYDIWGQKLR